MSAPLPLVGTFHCYSENRVSNNLANLIGARRRLNRLHVRIAVSEAAAWTGRRFYGGHYRVIPNGVDVTDGPLVRPADGRPLQIAFVGQSVERKGLPVLLRAFEALREHVPAELVVVGAEADEVAPAAARRPRRDDAGEGRTTPPRSPPCATRTSCARRRSEVRASAWCSPRRSPPGPPSSPPTYRAIPTSCAMASTACCSRAATPPPWPRRCTIWPSRRSAGGRWRRPPPNMPSAMRGRASPPRCSRPTRTRSRRPAPSGIVERAAVRVGAKPADLRPHQPARRLPSLEPARREQRPARSRARPASWSRQPPASPCRSPR